MRSYDFKTGASKVPQLTWNVCCSLGHDDKSVHAGAFDLTGKTGSLFYMAPEVANSEPYNEKA